MPPSARTYMGIILIFFGGSTLFGTRGQHAVNFPLMKQQAPTDTYKRKLPIWLASNSFFNHSLTKGQKQKKEDIPVLTGISSLT